MSPTKIPKSFYQPSKILKADLFLLPTTTYTSIFHCTDRTIEGFLWLISTGSGHNGLHNSFGLLSYSEFLRLSRRLGTEVVDTGF
jgi:hypothetical protein